MEQSNKNITNAETLTSEREKNLAEENGETQQANINDENMQDYDEQQPSEKDIVQPEDISNAQTENCSENIGRRFHASYAPWKSPTETSFRACVQALLTSYRVPWWRPLRELFTLVKRKNLLGQGRGCREAMELLRCNFCQVLSNHEAGVRWRIVVVELPIGGNFLSHSVDPSLQSF
ncbi:uncharacterized protein TNCV_4208451 [Trichonephila clavipes]|nr:uncharacterized protein TNCV_4208451 [Trichonephila clavipes]